MNKYKVLLPEVLVEQWEPTFGTIENEKWKFKIIDEVMYAWDTEDCRKSLIDHDLYNPFIFCIQW